MTHVSLALRLEMFGGKRYGCDVRILRSIDQTDIASNYRLTNEHVGASAQNVHQPVGRFGGQCEQKRKYPSIQSGGTAVADLRYQFKNKMKKQSIK